MRSRIEFMRRFSPCVLLSLVLAIAGGVAAQDYPVKPVRFVVGPGPDALARMVGQKLTDAWGQQVVIDQRPGAGGTIAAEIVARARGDGYTLLLATGSHTINAGLQKQSYDLVRDFRPVTLVASVPFILVVGLLLQAGIDGV